MNLISSLNGGGDKLKRGDFEDEACDVIFYLLVNSTFVVELKLLSKNI